MDIMKNIMLKNGINIEQMRKSFYDSGDDCDASIRNSKTFIIKACELTKKDIWDVVKDAMADVEKDESFSDYQKIMT